VAVKEKDVTVRKSSNGITSRMKARNISPKPGDGNIEEDYVDDANATLILAPSATRNEVVVKNGVVVPDPLKQQKTKAERKKRSTNSKAKQKSLHGKRNPVAEGPTKDLNPATASSPHMAGDVGRQDLEVRLKRLSDLRGLLDVNKLESSDEAADSIFQYVARFYEGHSTTYRFAELFQEYPNCNRANSSLILQALSGDPFHLLETYAGEEGIIYSPTSDLIRRMELEHDYTKQMTLIQTEIDSLAERADSGENVGDALAAKIAEYERLGNLDAGLQWDKYLAVRKRLGFEELHEERLKLKESRKRHADTPTPSKDITPH
jgi:hypothetical protein